MIHPIRLYGDPVLRKRAAPVERFDDELAQLASDMIETMHDAHGVGLAAPQIGISRRIFVAAELARPAEEEDDAEAGDGESEEDADPILAVHVMVNPDIIDHAGDQVAPDGCLSVPGLWIENMRRDARVTVRYQDETGAHHERTIEGHFAHVVQHELDHLDGILYFDHLDPDERMRFLEAHRTELADMQRRAKAFLKELRTSGVPAR